MGRQAFSAIAALALLTCSAGAETSVKDIAARVELHPIQSLTIPDKQFLTGDSRGQEVNVAGELRIAQGAGRLPAVILMHGSSGVGANIEPWVHRFNAMGISTLVIDGFTGRGLTTVGTNQALLGRLNLIVDIYRGLDILAHHSRVDPDRIALMGFSRGGQAALYASLERFHKLWNQSGARFAGYVPFYPDCATTYLEDENVADKPIRIFHGVPDDYNPIATCRAYVERLRQAGRDVVLTEYPNAQHAFDSPLLAGQVNVAAHSQTVRNCRIRETEPGLLINTATQLPFSYKDACVKLNPHVGGDGEATQAAYAAVSDLLRQVLKLN
jgi:dienelactone hydrolase